MIGLDTNVLVRCLVQDDAAQARAATATIEGAAIEHADHVRSAVAVYETTSADVADALVGRINEAAGCEHTVTLDRGLKRLPLSTASPRARGRARSRGDWR